MKKMKGNSNLKQGTVFLIAFVLVVGLAGAGGLVYGETRTSDVTVTVSDDTIEVDDVTYFDSTGTNRDIISDNAEGTDAPYIETDPDHTDTDGGEGVDFSVQVTVYSEDIASITHARINIFSEHSATIGAALGESENSGHFYNEWENTDWDGESETLNVDFETTADDTFLRYGDFDVYAEIVDADNEEETVLDYETFENVLFAEEHLVFAAPADVSGTVDPGQDIGTEAIAEDNRDVLFDPSNPQVNLEANFAWSLDMSDTTLVHEDEEIDDEITATTDDYENPTDNPIDNTDIPVLYLYETEEGTRPGTYSTTVTHTLTNDDANT